MGLIPARVAYLVVALNTRQDLSIRSTVVLALVVAQSFKILSQSCLTAVLNISKILRGESSLSSLWPPRCGNIIALLYKKLDMGSPNKVRLEGMVDGIVLIKSI